LTGVGFRTPFIVLFGVLLLPLLSFRDFSDALDGFVSEPLFWASGFASLELALLMLLLKFKESTLTRTAENIGQVLSFCYGVFVTVVVALAVKDISLYKQALAICLILTLLMLLVDFAYAGRSKWVNSKFSQSTNEDANKLAQKLLVAAMSMFGIMYVAFIYLK
jgi:VIT1/CCC1 family predicted Fe2+/Mn2+ transporter